MPYRSQAQARWAHTGDGEKELGGPSAVHEWDSATDFKSLPQRSEQQPMMRRNPKAEWFRRMTGR